MELGYGMQKTCAANMRAAKVFACGRCAQKCECKALKTNFQETNFPEMALTPGGFGATAVLARRNFSIDHKRFKIFIFRKSLKSLVHQDISKIF